MSSKSRKIWEDINKFIAATEGLQVGQITLSESDYQCLLDSYSEHSEVRKSAIKNGYINYQNFKITKIKL